MNDQDIEMEVFKVFTLAYRQDMTVKEYRRAVMEVGREIHRADIRLAIAKIMPHMSSVRLQGLMETAARAKAELQRRMLETLSDDEAQP